MWISCRFFSWCLHLKTQMYGSQLYVSELTIYTLERFVQRHVLVQDNNSGDQKPVDWCNYKYIVYSHSFQNIYFASIPALPVALAANKNISFHYFFFFIITPALLKSHIWCQSWGAMHDWLFNFLTWVMSSIVEFVYFYSVCHYAYHIRIPISQWTRNMPRD